MIIGRGKGRERESLVVDPVKHKGLRIGLDPDDQGEDRPRLTTEVSVQLLHDVEGVGSSRLVSY